ncbi:hypothetical protein ZIOFF_069818 [Zingiber officinale]|uniref:Glycine cleavage system H protein n=1 Tax=Zingiber officinale TaxID=94328 RepID=A0A8J5ES32_ZINOF|nr:hypothetical protein ZIOFF_069818 [Zingiber officinale]
MASRLLWASRVASYLKITTCPSTFSIVDGSTTIIGITDHAQDHLGDVVYIALLEVGSYVKQSKNFGAVESVKVNASSFEDGWIIKVKSSNNGEVNSLMDSEQYSKFYEEEDAKH